MVESLEKALLQSLDTNSQKAKSGKTLQRSELSLDISDILTLDLEVPCLESIHTEKFFETVKVRCCPILIGNEDFSEERLGTFRTCSALHCRNCDFPVSCFLNHEWIEHVEYLFLRTNMPNFEKVSEKLRKKNGSVAYSCHCVAFSTNKLQYLHEEDLPWFCRGHA